MDSDDATKPAEPASPARRSFLNGVTGADTAVQGASGNSVTNRIMVNLLLVKGVLRLGWPGNLLARALPA